MFTLLLPLLLVTLGLEEKVGQLLMPHFHGIEEVKKLIDEAHIGGVVYYNWSNGLTSPEQVKALSEKLQQISPIPLLIGIDQEGGIVSRLKEGFTLFPGARAMGLTDDLDVAEETAFAMGREMRAVGINLNFAPVVDVAWNEKSPLFQRSFGSSPEKVISFAERVMEGYQRASISSCLKHFPGHGGVEADSHFSLPVSNKSVEALFQTDLVPFAALSKKADCVMTAHIMLPTIDAEKNGTLSPKILGLLRNELGYDGVIITDSLVMKGVLEQADSVLDAALQAFKAGADILLLGGKQLLQAGEFELTATDVCNIHRGLVVAVQRGEISEERVDQSVQRILALKERHSSLPSSFTSHEASADRALMALLKAQAPELGNKIWKNECGGTIDGLVHWNKGEAFGSFGIGHFIWYPSDQKGPFDETFPTLMSFLKKEGVVIPQWLDQAGGCLWSSREHFLKELKSEKMVALKQFLFETKGDQALYIAYRLKESLPKMIEGLSLEQAAHLKGNVYRLLSEPQGLYALVDYLNFKGAGTSNTESYNGKGWGLKQVLMMSDGKLPSFIESAKKVLTERVENSPKERGEERWLQGWLARIDSYR